MKCKCKNPDWYLVHKDRVRVGKNFGKPKYTLACTNCGKMWTTMGKYAMTLEQQIRDNMT